MERLRRCRRYLWWLAGLAAFFAVYFPLRTCRTAMNWLCGRVILPLEQALGRLCSLTSLSVAEVLVLSGIYAALLYLALQRFGRGVTPEELEKALPISRLRIDAAEQVLQQLGLLPRPAAAAVPAPSEAG